MQEYDQKKPLDEKMLGHYPRNVQTWQQTQVYDFQQKMGMYLPSQHHLGPQLPPSTVAKLWFDLIAEEVQELQKDMGFHPDPPQHASVNDMLVAIADDIGDILYVVSGLANVLNIPVHDVFDEIQRSNMTKLWPGGTVHRREDGKILKPPGFEPPKLWPILFPNTPQEVSEDASGS